MQNESELQEWFSPNLEASQLMVEQDKKDGEGTDVVSERQPTADNVKAPAPTVLNPPPTKISESRYIDLVEVAVKRGQPSPAQVASQAPPRLLVGDGKWQSTLVTLTVGGAAGGEAACHHFSSDLWRYGGLAGPLQNLSWREADSIDLKLSREQIEVGLREAQTRRLIAWSWGSDETGVFRVRPEHLHVVEMVYGYLNLAAGAGVTQPVRGSFDLPHGSSRASLGGLLRGVSRSFVEFPKALEFGCREPYLPPHEAVFIDPADVVEALTRACGERLMLPEGSFQKRDRDDCPETEGSETVLAEGTVVQLPSAWSGCEGSPCVCGDSVMVLNTMQEQLQVRELKSGEEYLAISYVWAQHDESSLLSFIGRATEVIGVHLVWVDRLCINQRCNQHKSRQVPRMGEVYQRGYATVALIPEVTEILPTIFHAPTSIVPLGNISVSRHFTAQMVQCAWRTRCWTWQEGLLGRRGYYVTQKQVLPARIVSDVMVRGMRDRRQVCIRTGLMDSFGVRSLRCQIQTWRQEISIGDLLDAEDNELMQYWLMRRTKSLGVALRLTQARKALYPEDEIYSVLGMLPGARDFQVVYGESRNAILRRAVNAGLLGVEILCSDSVSNRGGESWAAEDDTSWHICRIYRLRGGMPGAVVCMDREIGGSAQIDDRGLRARFRRLEGLTGEAYLDEFNQNFCMLKLANSKEELRFSMNFRKPADMPGNMVGRMVQVLLLEKLRPGDHIHAVLVSGTGRDVVRVATGDVMIPFWMKLETQVVWRVIG